MRNFKQIIFTILSILVFSTSYSQTEESLYMQYCNADSNSILVGFKYIIDEQVSGSLVTFQSYYEIYNPKYHLQLPFDENRYYANSMYKFSEESVWQFLLNDEKEKYMRYEYPYTGLPYTRNPTYKRCEKITIPMKPTFEGFVQWKEKYKK